MADIQHLLASRDSGLHYDVADFEDDVETLAEASRMPSFNSGQFEPLSDVCEQRVDFFYDSFPFKDRRVFFKGLVLKQHSECIKR